MKRTLLIVVFLFISIGIFHCEEYDMNRIMPKKLVYAELPDDCPKELEELFIFYWDTVRLFADSDSTKKITLSDYMNTIELSKRYRLVYLLWLARNVIPVYFSEYYIINRYPGTLISSGILSKEEVDSLAICPTVQSDERITSAKSLITVNLQLWLSVNEADFLYGNLISPPIWPIWVRARVTDEWWEEGKIHIKISISEALGNKFEEDDIEVEVLMASGKRRHYYEIGEEYFINLGYRMDTKNNQTEYQIPEETNKHNIDYLSQQLRTYKIQNGNVVVSPLCFKHILQEILSKPGEYSFNDIRDQFNSSMERLREASNE